jgi:hypothetical protein
MIPKRSGQRNGAEGALRSAWGRFWFQPTDPSTLGFMRIIAGLIVIYIHVAYCFDLNSDFGAEGWWNLESANRERKESPFILGPLGWDEEYKPKIQTPQLPERRAVVFEFLKGLPEDKGERDGALRYLYFLLNNFNSVSTEKSYHDGVNLIYEAAQIVEQEERKQVLEGLSQEKIPKGLSITTPQFFLVMTPSERTTIYRQVEKLIEHTPWNQLTGLSGLDRLKEFRYWLDTLTPQDRNDLSKYLSELPAGPEARKMIEYFETWRLDPRDAYSKGRQVFSVYFHISNPATIWTCHLIILFIMVLFTVGFCTRVTSAMTWVAALFYIHRTNHILFGMDTMMNVLLFYLMIGPSGAALSVDRLMARYRAGRAIFNAGGKPVPWADAVLAGPRPSALANFAIRLIQIHFCFMYLASGLAKLKGQTWWNTTATWYTMANPEFTPLHYPAYEWWLLKIASHKQLLLVMFAFQTYFTLVLEIALPFLVWTRLRPIVVCLAILLHSAIAWIMGLTCFGLLMMTLLLSYVPASVIRERLTWASGTGRRLTLIFNSRSKEQGRLVASLRAVDLAGQISLRDEASTNPANGSPPRLVDENEEVYTGAEIISHAGQTLVLMRLFGWVPGVGALLRRFTRVRRFGGTAADDSRAVSRGPRTPTAK